MSRALPRIVGLIVAVVSAAPAVSAQERDSIVALAIRHREAGRFEAAIRVLAPLVARAPNDHEAARLHAQTLYWAHRFDDARAAYDAALTRHPDDAWLPLEYARMLAELGERRRARHLLRPLDGDEATRPYAEALLGTMAYWDGDFTSARRLFRRALLGDTSQAEVRRQLGEIAATTAPWISTGGDLALDNQPLVRRDVEATGGFTLTPNLWLFGEASTGQLQSADSLLLGVMSASAGAAHYAAAVRLETEVVAGLFMHGGAADADWTGRARVGFRLPRHLTVRAIAQRDPYLYTLASIRTPVMTRTATALIALASPNGWLGEAALQRTTFPDDNAVRTTYAWLLLPVPGGDGTKWQVGYGFTHRDSDESRFVLADSDQSVPAGDPTFAAPGVYDPYFTPERLVVHSLLVASERRSGRATVRIGGSYGVHATDYAPVLRAPPVAQPGNPSAVNREFVPRRFTPWTVRGGMDFAPTRDVTLGIAGNVQRTAFYTVGSARAVVTYRFAGAAWRRAMRGSPAP